MTEEELQLSIVIPMYNEEKIIKGTAFSLLEELRTSGISFEIIFSSDGSTDQSANIISTLCNENSEISLLCHPHNRGKGATVRDGVLKAKGEYIVFTDSDLAYGVAAVIEMYNTLKSVGTDIVIGSRNIHPDGYTGYTFLRKTASKTYFKTIKKLSGISYSDCQCGLKGFSHESGKRIFALCETNGFAFDFEVLMLADKMGYKIHEFPAKIIANNQYGSKVRLFSDAFKMLNDIRKINKRIKGANIEKLNNNTNTNEREK